MFSTYITICTCIKDFRLFVIFVSYKLSVSSLLISITVYFFIWDFTTGKLVQITIFVGGKQHVGRYSDRDNDRSNMLQMNILYFNANSNGVGHLLTYDNWTLCSLCELMHNKLSILFLFRPQRWSTDKKRHIFINVIIFGSNEDFCLIHRMNLCH